MSTRIALTEKQFGELVKALDTTEETAAVIGATLVPAAITTPSSSRRSVRAHPRTLLGRTVTWVADDDYLDRTPVSISIASPGWVPAFRAAIRATEVPVFIHTHPGGKAAFSPHDDVVDNELAAAARAFGASAYASMVVAGRSDAPAVVARLRTFDEPEKRTERMRDEELGNERLDGFTTVDAVRVAGRSLQLLLPPAWDKLSADSDHAIGEAFDRQVRMLGNDGQRTLSAVNAAVVGAGGTGSAVAVQLARIGIGTICLIDDDNVSAPTPTRGHGMRGSDIGRPKVEVLGQHLRDIGLETQVSEISAPLHAPEALQAIQHADVVFSCVDGHGARLILNRYAYAHLAVVIDLAVLVAVTDAPAGPDGADGRARTVEIDERVTWIGPGAACLLCRGRLDAALAYAENLDPETRKQLAGEGYVAAAETPQPAVVTLTTLVAALGATEFLLRLARIGAPEATELLLRPHIGELRRNRIPQRIGCFCSDQTYLGRGQTSPYLDLMWPTPPLEVQ